MNVSANLDYDALITTDGDWKWPSARKPDFIEPNKPKFKGGESIRIQIENGTGLVTLTLTHLADAGNLDPETSPFESPYLGPVVEYDPKEAIKDLPRFKKRKYETECTQWEFVIEQNTPEGKVKIKIDPFFQVGPGTVLGEPPTP